MSLSGVRPGFLAFALLLPVATIPPLLAARHAPAGQYFVGASFYADDYLQYLSFAEQASRGAFVFVNKFDPVAHPPALLNLEWWVAGALSRVLGDLDRAFRLVGLGALLAFTLGVARALREAGGTGERLGAAMALVLVGGGLGWIRFWSGAPGSEIPDLLMGLYPWHQCLSNPHFLVGTALLLWSLLFHLEWRRGTGPRWRWIATALALGLCRPYDMGIFVLVAALCAGADAWVAKNGAPLRQVADLLWLAPLFAYYALLVAAHPSFGGWGAQAVDVSPPLPEFAVAVLPGLATALLHTGRSALASSPALRTLAVWATTLILLLAVWTNPMAKQCVISLGAAVLLWAGAVAPVRWLMGALAVGLPTSALVLATALRPPAASYAPEGYRPALRLLQATGTPGDVAVAPTDLSLLVAAHTPCRVVLGHRLLTPRFAARVDAGRRFYDSSTSPAWRLEYLATEGATFAFLPPGRSDWLGADPAFTIVLRLPIMDVWRRSPLRVTMAAHEERSLRRALPGAEAAPHRRRRRDDGRTDPPPPGR